MPNSSISLQLLQSRSPTFDIAIYKLNLAVVMFPFPHRPQIGGYEYPEWRSLLRKCKFAKFHPASSLTLNEIKKIKKPNKLNPYFSSGGGGLRYLWCVIMGGWNLQTVLGGNSIYFAAWGTAGTK